MERQKAAAALASPDYPPTVKDEKSAAPKGNTAGMTEGRIRIKGLNHIGFRCRDAEETRAFYEDFLGLPLASAVTIERIIGAGAPQESLQLSFALPSGGQLTFVDSPATARPEQFAPTDGMEHHIALETDTLEALQTLKAALLEKDMPCFGPVDREGQASLYFWDPNGLQVEVTVPAPAETRAGSQTAETEGATPREQIASWSAETSARKAWLFPVRA